MRSLVDFGLESDEPEVFLKDLAQVPDAAGEEVKGDIAYLAGSTAELRLRLGASEIPVEVTNRLPLHEASRYRPGSTVTVDVDGCVVLYPATALRRRGDVAEPAPAA